MWARTGLCAATVILVELANATASSAARETANPVTKVVGMLKAMAQQIEAEGKEDEEIYDKFACYCETSEKEKTAIVEESKKKIEVLTNTIEVGTAEVAKLTGEVEALEGEIADHKEALETATALREKERAEFEAEAADLKEALGALNAAIQVLAKVQLVQRPGAALPESALLQVRALVSRVAQSSALMHPSKEEAGRFRSAIRRDLFDFLGEPAFAAAAPRRTLSTLAQQTRLRALPWEKTEEEAGMEAKPNDLKGKGAGAKSYNARSGQIFGILTTMQEHFGEDLKEDQKAALEAEIAFQRLRAAKTDQLQSATQSVEEKKQIIAETEERVAMAKEDLEATQDALSSAQEFLVKLKKICAEGDEQYAIRAKTRREEILAINEAIEILTSDDAKDLFSEHVSLLQIGRQRQMEAGTASLRVSQGEKGRRARAASKLLQLARRHGGSGGLRLALIAVSAQKDVFAKVLKMIDEMIVELKKQQAQEVEKNDACKTDIHANEMETMEKTSEKRDLEANIKELTATIESLNKDLEDLKTQVSEAHVALKTASEERVAQSKEFQATVKEQRETVLILKAALERLEEFYENNAAAFSQLHAKAHREDPAPPPAGMKYEESRGAAGVMSILEKIIEDVKKAEAETIQDEKEAQVAYEETIASTNELTASLEEAIEEKTIAEAKAQSSLVLAEKDLAAVDAALEDLAGINKGLHESCDYVLKNFMIRQKGRQEEIEALQQAKAILNGADLDVS